MKIKLLLLLLAVSTNFFGQTGFEENIVVGSPYETIDPQFVKAEDLDGDNDLDILVYGSELNWYENVDGQGNFGKKKTIAKSGSTALYVVDFDKDGDLDILGSVSNKFTLYKNTDGLGNFVVMQTFALGTEALTVMPSDVDGDGNIDIVCYYSIYKTVPATPKLVWFKNDGSGKLGEEKVINNSYYDIITASLLVTDDLDGDGDQDIIIGYRDWSKITWLNNTDGKGTFSAPKTISLLAGGVRFITTSDIDHDGDKDIISASANDKQIVWYKNLDGLGSFSDEIIIVSNADDTNAVLVADINNDSKVDIVYTSKNEIGWMSNTTGLGDFGSQKVITNKAFGVKSVMTGDIDGDGKKDLISASQDDHKVAWYKHIDGNGNFGRQVAIARRMQTPNTVYPGDFDGDKDIDLLVTSKEDAKLAWIENVNGLGFYGKQHIITENVEVGNVTPLSYPVDIDGDGDLDIASLKRPVFFWYENDGLGNFTIEHVIDNTSSVGIIRAKDIDGDGDMDLVCGVYNSNRISWYKNLDSKGTFGDEQVIDDTGGTNGSLTSLEIEDMDGDKDMDIIASSYNTNTYYYRNKDGLGNFESPHMSVFGAMESVYPADVDGDGDKDIVGVSANGGGTFDSVVWYENSNGKGDFSPVKHDISTLTTHGQSIYAADIDNDGDIDVLTASGHPDTSGLLAWYENKGKGDFYERKTIHEIFDYHVGLDVNVADVDNDNDLDVLAVFNYYRSTVGKISVFENLGPLGNKIQGRVLIDSDSNGCTDADIKGSNLMVISNNGSDSFATFTDQNGSFHVAANEGNFTTSITSQLPDYFASNPKSHTFNFSGMNNKYLADFCIASIEQISDLNVSLYPALNDVRPGFGTHYRIVYRNMGTKVSGGTVKFEYNNNKLSLLKATQTISSQTANTLTFDFTNLKPFETRTIDLDFTVFAPPVTNINDEVISSVTVIPASGEEKTEDNNSFSLNQTVIGSYDPNDIACLEGDQVLIDDSDKFLHYIIRFQNTGNASAINVKVENILDDKLDWTSMQLESLSHNGSVEITNGKEVKFIFDNINLPDSNKDEPNSHGFIAYKIKPLSTVVAGNIINNKADIYFDFNPPIITNTASTQFTNKLSVVENEADHYNIYPSPTTDLLNIQANTIIEKVSLIDINGRLLKEYRFNTPTLLTQLDLTHLVKGIYFLKIKSDKDNTVRKIIKK